METTQPFNISLLNIDNYIKSHGCIEIKSSLIWEPSSTNLHPDGLFSEGIFGQIGTTERISRIGFISLHTKILAPLIYKNTLDMKSVYGDIMEGRVYATFDEKLGDFIPCDKTKVGANTGYSFFISCFDKLKFVHTNSHTRTSKIKVIEKARKEGTAIWERLLVLPAGLRDLKQEGDRFVVEDINKLYSSIITLSLEIKDSNNSPFLAMVYDGVKYNIQKKAYELYDYHKEFFSGKTGFGQRRFARRAVAHGTRNVITGANMQGSHPNDPRYHKHTETIFPLYQTMKMFQPLVIYNVKTHFYNVIFSAGILQVTGISPKTKQLEYVTVTDSEINKMLNTDSLENLISAFQNVHMRSNPVGFKDENNNFYWLFLIYDTGSDIYILRNIEDFIVFMSKQNIKVDINLIRPLTYVEMFYIATIYATQQKNSTATRYPAIELGSIYPTTVKIDSTVPSRSVNYRSQFDPDTNIHFSRYPIIGNSYKDSMVIHPSQVAGLGADYDGDMMNALGLFKDDSNKECHEYLNHIRSIISPQGTFIKSASTDITDLTYVYLTTDQSL